MFQIDSKIVRSVYSTEPNYDYDESSEENVCAIYFSSNDIYFPNTEEIFRKRIVEKNFFEWYHTRVKARKHIFVRDVFKQWYIEGINTIINSPEKMEEWLKTETLGYQVITVGSSAGGYAAVLYGSLLKAVRVIAFNAQFSLMPAAHKASNTHDPLLFKYLHTDRASYFQLKDFLQPSVKYYYFLSVGCAEDNEQSRLLLTPTLPSKSLCCIKFATSHHGIPFLKVALGKVLNMNDEKLASFAKQMNHPMVFTISIVGIRKTIVGFVKQAYKAYKKRK